MKEKKEYGLNREEKTEENGGENGREKQEWKR